MSSHTIDLTSFRSRLARVCRTDFSRSQELADFANYLKNGLELVHSASCPELAKLILRYFVLWHLEFQGRQLYLGLPFYVRLIRGLPELCRLTISPEMGEVMRIEVGQILTRLRRRVAVQEDRASMALTAVG